MARRGGDGVRDHTDLDLGDMRYIDIDKSQISIVAVCPQTGTEYRIECQIDSIQCKEVTA